MVLFILFNYSYIFCVVPTIFWKDEFKGTFDSPAPLELVKDKKPLAVKASTELKIITDYTPDELMVRLWKDTETINQNLRENKLIVPKEKGRYVYEILGKWSQGKARYAFLIEVK